MRNRIADHPTFFANSIVFVFHPCAWTGLAVSGPNPSGLPTPLPKTWCFSARDTRIDVLDLCLPGPVDFRIVSRITRLLESVKNGEEDASQGLLSVVYDELHGIASYQLSREAAGHTLQTTALVNEAFLKLFGNDSNPGWENRAHFFGAAAEAMRRILVDHARRKRTQKRGGKARRSLDVEQLTDHQPDLDELLDVNDVLAELEETHPVHAQVVKLRYFAGLTIDQTAELLEISVTTANRYWAFARAWLFARIRSGENS